MLAKSLFRAEGLYEILGEIPRQLFKSLLHGVVMQRRGDRLEHGEVDQPFLSVWQKGHWGVCRLAITHIGAASDFSSQIAQLAQGVISA